MPLTPQREALLKLLVPPGSESRDPATAEAARKTLTDGDEAAVLALAADACSALRDAAQPLQRQVMSLSADKATLESQLDAAESRAEALALSADAPRHSPEDAADYLGIAAELRELCVRDGLPEAKAKRVDALLADATGNPLPLALSAHGTGPDRRRFGVKLWKTIRELFSDAPARRAPDPKTTATMTLDAGGAGGGQKMPPERRAALRDHAGLPAAAS